MKYRVGWVIVSTMLHLCVSKAQTGELEEDASTIGNSVDDEETLDRLRLEPIDLRKARVTDLLLIPGVRKRDASLVLQAVRSGRISRMDEIVFIPEITPGLFDLLAPYATISRESPGPTLDGFMRMTAKGTSREDPWRWAPSRQQVLLTSSTPGAFVPAGRLNVRWSADQYPSPRVHATTTAFDEKVEISLGHVAVRAGSPLLDDGRKMGLSRPSDWDRSLSHRPVVRLGTDDVSMGRGFMVQFRTEERLWFAGHLVHGKVQGSEILSVSERVWDGLRITAAWRSDIRAFSGGLLHDGQNSVVRVELARSARGSVSGFAFCGWGLSEEVELQILLRHLWRITAAGIPRHGNDGDDEEGGAVSVRMRPIHGWKLQFVMDVSRLRRTIDPRDGVWSPARAVAILNEISLAEKTRLSCEVGWNLRSAEQLGLGTVAWTQNILNRISWDATISVKKERDVKSTVMISRMMRVNVKWEFGGRSCAVRWTSVRGTEGIEFWNVGPGNAALSAIRPLAGRTTLIQAAANGRVGEKLLVAGVVSQAIIGQRDGPARRDLSASILGEIRL